jgi:hypothetical protein
MKGSEDVLEAPLEQVAHDRYRSGPTHALGRLRGIREAEHLMATGHERLDRL